MDDKKLAGFAGGFDIEEAELACRFKNPGHEPETVDEMKAEIEFLRKSNDKLSSLNQILRARAIQEDKTASAESEIRLDPVTGLGNRSYVTRRINEEIARFKRSETEFCVLLIDIDDFEEFNFNHGHDMGDMLLQVVARSIQRHLRGMDVVSRWRGDQFLIVLPETKLANAEKVSERLRDDIDKLRIYSGDGELHVTVTVGVACYNEENMSYNQIILLADQARFQGKAGGKNKVVLA